MVNSFLYIAPRDCTKFESNASIPIGDLSENAISLIEPMKDDVSIDICDDNTSFIRIICDPYIAQDATNSFSHDDILLYAEGNDMMSKL